MRATRAQADRILYKASIRHTLENQPNLTIFQQPVDDIIVENGRAVAVVTATGIRLNTRAVVLTSGTFLGGVIHVGLDYQSGGRAGDMPSIRLADRLRELKLPVGRLKTGTPARIDARTVDFSVMTPQPGDTPLPVMSYMGDVAMHPRQINCYITHTNERTHDIIRTNLDRSPMFSGKIEGWGPVIAQALRIRFIALLTKTVIRFLLSLRASPRMSYTPMAFQRVCRLMCKLSLSIA